jgi:hypothetical protein
VGGAGACAYQVSSRQRDIAIPDKTSTEKGQISLAKHRFILALIHDRHINTIYKFPHTITFSTN